MTVSTTENVIEYVDGGPDFPIPYRFLRDEDIQVELTTPNGLTETLSAAQYSLVGAGSAGGGTMSSAYASGVLALGGAILTVSRIMAPLQPIDLRNQGRYLAETQETGLDRLTMLIQQGINIASRALRRPVGKNYYDAQGRQIKNLGTPTEPQDATTKGYVDYADSEISSRVDALSAGLPGTNYAFPWSTITTQSTKVLTPGFTFFSATLSINGFTQTLGRAYSVVNNTIVLAEAIPAGTEVSAILGQFVLPIDFALKSELADSSDPTKGAALIGFDGGLASDVLKDAKAVTSYANLRLYTGLGTTLNLIDGFRSGRFRKVATVPTGYTDDGGITIIGANGWVWQRINVGEAHVDWFLAPGWVEGVTDDKVAFERASQHMRARGGGKVRFFRRHLLDSTTYVNDLVHLQGPYPCGGELLNGVKDYNLREGVLILNPAGTLYMESSASISGGIIIRKGMTLPFVDEAAAIAGVASFSGVAVTSGGPDSNFSDCLVLGFDKAYYSNGLERGHISNIRGDCNNGIHINACFDVADVTCCQFWPFLTAHRGFASDVSKRSGTAYLTSNSDDWGRYTNCFSYGYNRGFVADSANNISWINCAADWAGELVNTTSIGFELTGTSMSGLMVACRAASQWRGVSVNTSAPSERAAMQIIGGQFWNNDNTDIRVILGRAIITGNTLRGSPTGIFVESTSLGSIITSNFFESHTVRPIDGTMTQVTGGNNTFAGTVDTVMGERKYTTGGSLSDRVDSVYGNASNNIYRRAAGTPLAPAAVADGSSVVSFAGQAHNGTGFAVIAAMRIQTRAAQTTSSAAGGIVFSTCPAGSTTSVDRLLLDSDGSLSGLLDSSYSLGKQAARWADTYSTRFRPGAGAVIWTSGTGTPEGVVTAAVGSMFTRTDGGALTTLYIKETGAGNTGWVAK